jgi:hypothetical protein
LSKAPIQFITSAQGSPNDIAIGQPDLRRFDYHFPLDHHANILKLTNTREWAIFYSNNIAVMPLFDHSTMDFALLIRIARSSA